MAGSRRIGTWLALGAAFVLTLAYTAPYGTLNQATYLLDPLHRAMPELYRRDWFVTGTPPYLPVFGWLFQWLYVLDPEGTTAVITAHVVSMFATYVAIGWLVRAVGGGWRAFITLAAFVALSMDLSMGGSYLVTGYFQPSSLSTIGWIVAMAALARDRYLLCGIAAALAGLLHANFLVLGVGLFGLAAFVRRDMTWREIALVVGPQLVVLACFVPQLLSAAGPSKHATWILTHFHAPVHYDGTHLVGWIKELVAWQIGGFAALQLLAGSKAARTLWRFSLVSFAIVTITALLIRYTPLEWLTQARWSRAAPFGQLACQVLMVSALARQALAPQPLTRRTRLLVGAGMTLALILPSYHLRGIVPLPVWAVGALAVVLVLVPRPTLGKAVMTLLPAIAVGYALWKSPRGVGLRIPSMANEPERALVAWVRTETPTDALFLAPPDLMRFRLLARRAVIADAKSPPLRPDLLEAWHQRLCAMVLDPAAPTFQAAVDRYAQLTPEQLGQVARTFGADYIVVRTGVPFEEAPLYTNVSYSVYRAPTP